MNTLQTSVQNWLTTNQPMIFSIICILLVALAITFFGDRIIKRAVASAIKSKKHTSKAEELKREKTVAHIISRILKIVVWPLAIMSIIAQLGVQVGPLLAGAGIVGLALGFGAQTLVKDMISGLFIIIENQYGVGDVVMLEGVSGVVEDITLRKTTLRDMDGTVHHIPNGTIMMASNLSSDFAKVNLNIGVAYNTNLEQVVKVVNTVGLDMTEDAEWSAKIIEPPAFLRFDNFGPNEIIIKVVGKVQPLTQWEVTGELRKRLKLAFDKAGIEIPFPQTVIHQAGDTPFAKKKR